MILISREYLCIHTSENELDEVSLEELRAMLVERPANVVYFETPRGLYGIVSYGDITMAHNGKAPINKSFVSFAPHEYMNARKRILKSDTICEIPAVEGGCLVGEFHKFDDELMFDRLDWPQCNAHAQMYFSGLVNIALVKPPTSRGYKLRYFDWMRGILDRFKVGYTVLEFAEMIPRLEEFEFILLVDEQERRGAQLILSLFEDKPHLFKHVRPYSWLLEKLNSSEVMDFEYIINGVRDKGADVVLITAARYDSDYVNKTMRKMHDRFPIVFDDINDLMKPYEEQFFDDLFQDREYVNNIENGYFFVEKYRESMRLMDTASPHINVVRGERVTTGQPDDYTRTIYFYGPCLIVGSYVGDNLTIESHLQKMINDRGYKVRVVNYGCWGGNYASISRMISTPIREGDVVVMLLEDQDMGIDGIKRVDLWKTLEKNNVPSTWLLDLPQHANHHVTKLYAEELFSVIFDDGYVDAPALGSRITQDIDVVDAFYIKKYFNGIDLDRHDKVACCVFNGNPFTNGHRHVIETASREMDHVYLLVVKEESSVFSFNERFAMAFDACADLENVTVVPSGLFIGNISNFPAYYAKVFEGDAEDQARAHVEAFASIATLLHATHRYVGEEPSDPVADAINRMSKKLLPDYGIETVVLERKTAGGEKITGSRVRELAASDDPALRDLVPEATADIIRCESINRF